MPENKTQPTSASVEDFIAGLEVPRRRADAQTALELYQEITGQSPVMWGPSIIGFGVRQYRYESGREGSVPAAGFSPRKANLTFYVGAKFEGAGALYERLGKHRKSVACLYINKLADVDVAILREIIERDFLASNPASDTVEVNNKDLTD
ncbi:MAG: DUF1801 domain-containing protein [Saccharospirillum sp.]